MLFNFVITCLIAASHSYRIKRIVYGDKIDITYVPYMVNVGSAYIDTYPGFYTYGSCSGAIIADSWILTAAHCLKGADKVTVYSGTKISMPRRIIGSRQKHLVEKVIMHENYFEFNDKNIPPENDIALLKLKKPIKFDDHRQPIPIVGREDYPEHGEIVMASGYGITEAQEKSLIMPLKYIKEKVINQLVCKDKYYPKYDISKFFCSKSLHSGGTCEGDSGGPGVIDGKLAGVLSYGFEDFCNTDYGPDLYTRVDLYNDWILKHINS